MQALQDRRPDIKVGGGCHVRRQYRWQYNDAGGLVGAPYPDACPCYLPQIAIYAGPDKTVQQLCTHAAERFNLRLAPTFKVGRSVGRLVD